jgi:nucleoside-diphosphate-sugar epimerase
MRIAVAGATGHIGSLAPSALERDGHEVVRISRSLGVDLLTGEGWTTLCSCNRSPRPTSPT